MNLEEKPYEAPLLSSEKRDLNADINRQTEETQCWMCEVNRAVRQRLCSACLIAIYGE